MGAEGPHVAETGPEERGGGTGSRAGQIINHRIVTQITAPDQVVVHCPEITVTDQSQLTPSWRIQTSTQLLLSLSESLCMRLANSPGVT